MATGGASRAARLAAQLAAAVDSSSAAAIKCGCASASCNCASSAVKSRPGTERRRRLARSWLQLSEPVQAALRAGRAVVALESTIISHGMPYPQNLQTAIEVEAVVQRNGAVPATIAVLDGQVKVGLTEADLRRLAELGPACRKLSRRDVAAAIAERANGATTVAATMLIAHAAGIRVFVTGGVGGVHRGFEETMDVSADLTELGRTPVAVFCAGVKSILDIGRTLEYLETQGVSVVTLGSREFPAFFTRHSGFDSPLTASSEEQCARMILANIAMRLGSGMIFAVPIPESEAAAAKQVQDATEQALAEAKQRGIAGRDVTPFLLKRINELTGGESLRSNIALIKNNAATGARTAALVGTSNPGQLIRSWGGVARNVAEVLGRLNARPCLVSVVGSDETGSSLLAYCKAAGVETSMVKVGDRAPTSTYVAIMNEKGDLFTTIADMAATADLSPEYVRSALREMSQRAPVSMVVIDGNLEPAAISAASEVCRECRMPLWFEPTSVVKATRGLDAIRNGAVDYVSPSERELVALSDSLGCPPGATVQERANSLVSRGVKCVVAKLGASGIALATKDEFITYKALPSDRMVNTSGCGDSLVGATVWAMCVRGLTAREAVKFGLAAARFTLESPLSVSPLISPARLEAAVAAAQEWR